MLEYLKDKNVGALCPPLFLPAKSCVGHCESKKINIIKGLRIWETKSLGILDTGEPTGIADLCSRCRVEVRRFTKKTRQDFWVHLPTFYSLRTSTLGKFGGWLNCLRRINRLPHGICSIFYSNYYHSSNSLWHRGQSKPPIKFCLLMSLSWLTKSPIT